MVCIKPLGVQSFRDRFGNRRYEDAPPVAQWRCNLTALSQTSDLLFIAYTSHIHVYCPSFPSQTIPSKPLLIFSSQPSQSGLAGPIDPRNPHAVNNLLVRHLGTEEIVACVRDDGDADAFYLRHIISAIERRAELGSELGIWAEEVRPFFQRNVGISAWGLDVHAQARMIATSSNAHEVRIFKFGLLKPEDSDDDGGEGLNEGNAGLPGPSDRGEDVTIQILNGNSNIPAISFCNIPDIDPEGRWLLTTDIAGITRLVDLQSLTAVRTFRFDGSWSLPLESFDRWNAGWGVTFLDPRAFAVAEDNSEALGLDDEHWMRVSASEGIEMVWDISSTVSRLQESREPLIYHPSRTPRRVAGETDPSQQRATEPVVSTELNIEVQIDDSNTDREASNDSTDDEGGVSLDMEIDLPESTAIGATHIAAGVSQHPSTTDATSPTITQLDDADQVPLDAGDDNSEASDTDNAALIDDGDTRDDGSNRFTGIHCYETVTSSCPRFLRAQTDTDAIDGNNDDHNYALTLNNVTPTLPACPILCASVRNLYLLQPFCHSQSSHTLHASASPRPRSPSTHWTYPMVGIASPLRQRIHADFAYLAHYERLNMQLSIPELGVVVLASQKGRALVLKLTKLRAEVLDPPETAKRGSETPKGGRRKKQSVAAAASRAGGTKYCFRVAAILPFAHQERRNERPFAPLLGIAGAPLQGCASNRIDVDGYGQDKEGRRRLLLIYQDHGVLSYEISRDSGGDLDVGGLMV